MVRLAAKRVLNAGLSSIFRKCLLQRCYRWYPPVPEADLAVAERPALVEVSCDLATVEVDGLVAPRDGLVRAAARNGERAACSEERFLISLCRV